MIYFIIFDDILTVFTWFYFQQQSQVKVINLKENTLTINTLAMLFMVILQRTLLKERERDTHRQHSLVLLTLLMHHLQRGEDNPS